MSLLCSRCGRRLMRSAIPEPEAGVSIYAALGPVCARKAGMLTVRPPLFTRVRVRRRDPRQLEIAA